MRIDYTAPSAFSLASPAGGTDTSDQTPLFDWNDSIDTVAGIKWYGLQLSTSASFAGLVLEETTLSISLNISQPLAENTYYWRVICLDRALNQSVSTEYNEIYIDQAPPSSVSLSYPDNSEETNIQSPYFSWNQSSDTGSGLSFYRLELSTSPGFAAVTVSETAVTASLTLAASMQDDTYYWRVLAVDNASNLSPAGETRALIIDTLRPPSPALLGPSDGSDTYDTSPLFAWGSVTDTGSGLEWYRIEFSTSQNFQSIYYADTATASSYSISSGFSENTYWWRVTAVDGASNSSQVNDTRSITVDFTSPSEFSPVYPADNTDTSDTTPYFTWSASLDTGAGFSWYRLELSTSAAFAQINYSGTTVSTGLVLPVNTAENT